VIVHDSYTAFARACYGAAMKKVAILGSGKVGEVLAGGFLQHGYAVMRSSREPGKLEAWKASAGANASIGSFAESARWCDLAVLAVKGTAAEAVVREIGASLTGKTVLDATNPIADGAPKNGVLAYFTAQNESLMERLQNAVPGACFVKAFNSVGNALMVNPKLPMPPNMFICGNDAAAKRQASEILGQFGWEAIDLGAVEAARPIESLCVLWCIPGFLRNDWMHAIQYVKAG
jgi:predicted dinucleotide-binding enzyme